MASVDICIVCAWRENCQKKFSISGKNVRCPDFSKDFSIPEEEKERGTDPGEKENT